MKRKTKNICEYRERTKRPRSAALGCAKRTVVVVVEQCVSRTRLLLLRPVLPRATWSRPPRRNVIADSEAKIVAGQRLYSLLSHRPVPGSRLQDRLLIYSSLTAALSRVHAR
ncbi:unnamed protein product [Trichogramma brassicae]|uniref:Uncharacterized protein n=1 Tax=Trichogramma brassicae TaxID=86971 RepID=A0A6H5I4Y6_9HYME|nr:unnamed protein product [Trichogramma brassicae]